MSKSSVSIGSISLQDFEVPTVIQYGGRHRLVIHKLSDGTRAVEQLGPDDSQIRFEGTFSGADAEHRARAIDSLRIGGSIVALTWHSFRYRVIISEFSARYYSRWWIGYRISCVVVAQTGTARSPIDMEGFIVAGALSMALLALTGTPIDLTPLSSAVGVTSALVIGTDAHTSATLAASRTMVAIQGRIDQQSEIIVSSNYDSGNPADSATSFMSQVTCSAALANAVSARSYVGRVVTSLNSPGT